MIEINLIPVSHRRARNRRVRLYRWLTSCMMGIVTLAVVGGIDWLQHAEAKDLVERHALMRDRLVELRQVLDAGNAESNRLGLQIDRARALHAKRPWSGMIALFAGNLPEGSWIGTIATVPDVPLNTGKKRIKEKKEDEDGADPEAARIDAPHAVRITGFALEAADPIRFVAGLKESNVFVDVRLELSDQQVVNGKDCFRFEVLCTWN